MANHTVSKLRGIGKGSNAKGTHLCYSRVAKMENCELGKVSPQENPLATEPRRLVGVERMNHPGRREEAERGRKTDEGRTSALMHMVGPI